MLSIYMKYIFHDKLLSTIITYLFIVPSSQGNSNKIVSDISLNGNKLLVSYFDNNKKELTLPFSNYYTKAEIDKMFEENSKEASIKVFRGKPPYSFIAPADGLLLICGANGHDTVALLFQTGWRPADFISDASGVDGCIYFPFQ